MSGRYQSGEQDRSHGEEALGFANEHERLRVEEHREDVWTASNGAHHLRMQVAHRGHESGVQFERLGLS